MEGRPDGEFGCHFAVDQRKCLALISLQILALVLLQMLSKAWKLGFLGSGGTWLAATDGNDKGADKGLFTLLHHGSVSLRHATVLSTIPCINTVHLVAV